MIEIINGQHPKVSNNMCKAVTSISPMKTAIDKKSLINFDGPDADLKRINNALSMENLELKIQLEYYKEYSEYLEKRLKGEKNE